jgi:hypothetical protein
LKPSVGFAQSGAEVYIGYPITGGKAVKKVNRLVPDVTQRIADRGTEVLERHLAAYGVSRAMELPEEGKVRLMRDLQGFSRQELPDGLQMIHPSDIGWRGAIKRAWQFMRGQRRVTR